MQKLVQKSRLFSCGNGVFFHPKRLLSGGQMQALESARLRIEKTKSPRPKVPKEQLTFGTSFADHMLELDWSGSAGWSDPKIRPYGDLRLSPAASCLHYGLQCFEGMKAYKTSENDLLLFRPDLNMKRLNQSMTRLHMPQFDETEFLECLKELVRLDQDWIPSDPYSLYIRPTAISTHPYLGVGASDSLKMYVILSPVGPYYPSGFAPVELRTDASFVRAWPGGTGHTKIGGNYGPTILPQTNAAKSGYSQILWLFGEDEQLTEVGTMNLFVCLKDAKTGRTQLMTPSITRGDILPGVTRQSILELSRTYEDVDVLEQDITLPELKAALAENRLLEVFGSGTAAVISPVSVIHHKGEDLHIPHKSPDLKDPSQTKLAGPLTQKLWQHLTDIHYGRISHPWSVKL